jgi:hypothetical protein
MQPRAWDLGHLCHTFRPLLHKSFHPCIIIVIDHHHANNTNALRFIAIHIFIHFEMCWNTIDVVLAFCWAVLGPCDALDVSKTRFVAQRESPQESDHVTQNRTSEKRRSIRRLPSLNSFHPSYVVQRLLGSLASEIQHGYLSYNIANAKFIGKQHKFHVRTLTLVVRLGRNPNWAAPGA